MIKEKYAFAIFHIIDVVVVLDLIMRLFFNATDDYDISIIDDDP